MIKKVISGMQTGSDIGGLMVAEKYGITTGGWAPKGYKTEVGPKPDWGKRFNILESTSNGYIGRTYANAKMGDGTIRFARNFQSAGEICTLKAIEKFNKPYIDVDYDNPRPVEEIVDWINKYNINILNIAGNRESYAPGIQLFVEEYLSRVFQLLD